MLIGRTSCAQHIQLPQINIICVAKPLFSDNTYQGGLYGDKQ